MHLVVLIVLTFFCLNYPTSSCADWVRLDLVAWEAALWKSIQGFLGDVVVPLSSSLHLTLIPGGVGCSSVQGDSEGVLSRS